jgi:hypothetical protein
MRYPLGALGATVALTATTLAGMGGVAQAEPATAGRLYAPSALVLTIGKGDDAATASVQRAVLLNCAPTPSGTHPAADQACRELHAVNGEFPALTVSAEPDRVCTKIWNPVVITVDGVWEGRRVSWAHTFPNDCVMTGAEGFQRAVFHF